MASYEKLYRRMCTLPKDFTLDELRKVMKHNGFVERNRGKTSGSAICFYRESDDRKLMFHKPHPENNIPRYVLENAISVLKG